MYFLKKREIKRKIFIASLPKAGTHLLKKCIIEIAGVKDKNMFLDNRFGRVKRNISLDDENGIKVGIDDPNVIKTSIILNLLRSVPENNFLTAHIPFSIQLEQLLRELGFISFAIIRDPRDVVVSHAHFILKTKKHYLHEYYKNLNNFQKCLMTSICGLKNDNQNLILENIKARFESIANWRLSPDFFLIRFEDLVGERGGGNAEVQKNQVEAILSHLQINSNEKKIEKICANIFGKSYTFRKGKIGSWKEEFDEYHKNAFKKVGGNMLVKSGYEKDMNW